MHTLTDSSIQEFAAGVRAELQDLPRATIEELTGDLEAGLQERQLDEGDAFTLGSPQEYAAELREAAGLAPKSKVRGLFSKDLAKNIESRMRRSPALNAILEFGISIRAIWWVTRAFIAWGLFFGFWLSSTSSLVTLILLILLSIQWGRGQWFKTRFFKAILLPLNILAIALLPISGGLVIGQISNFYNAQLALQQWPATDGLRLNGVSVTEIKAIDEQAAEVHGLHFLDTEGNDLLADQLQSNVQVAVPGLEGMTLLEAQQALDLAGINNVEIVYENGVTEVNGVVSHTFPTVGSSINVQSLITIYLDKK